MLEPIQLSQFISEISRTSNIEGSIVEVGAFRGLTTCFALEHMKNEKINKTYYAIDTFEGFISTDVDYISLSYSVESAENIVANISDNIFTTIRL